MGEGERREGVGGSALFAALRLNERDSYYDSSIRFHFMGDSDNHFVIWVLKCLLLRASKS